MIIRNVLGLALLLSCSFSFAAFTSNLRIALPKCGKKTFGTSTATTATTLSRSSSSWSPTILQAKSAGGANKSKKSNNAKLSRRGGGGGFGAIAKKAPTSNKQKPSPASSASATKKGQEQPLIPSLSAADIAKLNTLHTQQRELQRQQEVVVPNTDEPQPPPLETSSEVTKIKVEVARKTRRKKWSERSDLVETAAENSQWKEIYAQEYQQQLEPKNQSHKNKGQLVKVSTDPLIFTIDEFIDPDLCRRVENNADGCFDLFFPERLADVIFDGQESELDGLLFNTANSREHAYVSPASHYPDGLHMDTNNQCLFRHVTCILYLNDIPEECGAATVFPLARTLPEDPALAAARRLLDQKLSHTRSRSCETLGREADAQLIETRVGTSFLERPDTDTAIRIQPRAGRLLIFFSRDDNGKEDPRTWHAGERIQAGKDGSMTEKRILTLFKEVDYEGIPPPSQAASTFEAFLAPFVEKQRKWLLAKAQLQSALLQQYGNGYCNNMGMEGQ